MSHEHHWGLQPGKPVRCTVCHKPILPWHRRLRTRILTQLAIVRGNLWRWTH